MRKITLIIITLAIGSLLLSSCGTTKYGCPAANSEGRVRGKFRA